MKTTLLLCLALTLVLVYLTDYTEGYQVFVHWGQKGCPVNKFDAEPSDQLVRAIDGRKKRQIEENMIKFKYTLLAKVIYYGSVAKSEWGGRGGGSEFICLPEEPEWARYKDGMQFGSPSGTIYGNSQIHGTQFVEFGLAPELGSDIGAYQGADVPCTLCETVVAAHHVMMMMPAKLKCPSTWTKQYSGYLMAEPSKRRKSQSNYICVDGYKGFTANGNQDPHARLAFVEVGCRNDGLIPCSVYPAGRELTCVVCVK